MSIQVFNEAIQAARQAVIDQNHGAFDSALVRAQDVTQNVPKAGVHLQHARESFPALRSLSSLTMATIIVTEATP